MPEEEENDQTPPPVEESVEAPAVESKDTAENDDDNVKVTSVSYTHLTLPTKA